jgi:hypothetical protein
MSLCDSPFPGLDIFLQVSTTGDAAKAFYLSCGFVQHNTQDTIGVELLPKSINAFVMANGYSWFWPESSEHLIFPLMYLPSGGLLKPVSVTAGSEIKEGKANAKVAASDVKGEKGDRKNEVLKSWDDLLPGLPAT